METEQDLINKLIKELSQIDQKPVLAKVEIPPQPEIENDPISAVIGIGGILGGVGGGLAAAGIAGATAWTIAAGVVGGITIGMAGGQILGSLIAGVAETNLSAPDFQFIQSRKSSPTYTFTGSNDNLATNGSPIPLVYCNYEDNKWGGVRYQGKIVSMYLENTNNKGDAYVVSILSNGYLEKVDLDNIYLGLSRIDEVYQEEKELYIKYNDNERVASFAQKPEYFRLASQVVFPENYNTISANYITETTNYYGGHRWEVEVMNGQWGGTIWYENAITKFNGGKVYTSEGWSSDYWQQFFITRVDEGGNKIYGRRSLTGYLTDGFYPNDKELSSGGQGNPNYIYDNNNHQPIMSGRIFEINKAYYKTSKLVNKVRFNMNVLLYKTRLAQYEGVVSGS